MDENMNGALDWNSVIDTDGDSQYIELEEGDYTFSVDSVERSRFNGSDKIPPCPKAVINLSVYSDKGVASAKTNLLLNSTLKWKIAQFFRCIGLKKPGESMVMDWDAVPGKMGRAHFKPRPYIDRNGVTRRANELDSFYDYDETLMNSTPIPHGAPWENVEA